MWNVCGSVCSILPLAVMQKLWFWIDCKCQIIAVDSGKLHYVLLTNASLKLKANILPRSQCLYNSLLQSRRIWCDFFHETLFKQHISQVNWLDKQEKKWCCLSHFAALWNGNAISNRTRYFGIKSNWKMSSNKFRIFGMPKANRYLLENS